MVKEPKLNEHNQKNFFKIFGFFVNLGQLWEENPQITVRKIWDFRIFSNSPNFEKPQLFFYRTDFNNF